MLQEPNWELVRERIVTEGRIAINSFAQAYPSQLCCCFALAIDHCFGNLSICFDTPDNSLLHAKINSAQILQSRNAMLASENGWENAAYFLTRDTICCKNNHTANFKFPTFACIHFSDWEEYFLSEELPDNPDPLGRLIVALYKAISDLVATHAFDAIKRTSQFRVGVEFPQDLGFVLLNVLDW